jgi:hypothetical protein
MNRQAVFEADIKPRDLMHMTKLSGDANRPRQLKPTTAKRRPFPASNQPLPLFVAFA